MLPEPSKKINLAETMLNPGLLFTSQLRFHFATGGSGRGGTEVRLVPLTRGAGMAFPSLAFCKR